MPKTSQDRHQAIITSISKAAVETASLEALITRVSAKFVNLPVDEIDEAIEETLQELAEFFDVGRAGLLEYQDDGKELVTRAVHVAPGASPLVNTYYRERFPWYVGQLTAGKVLVYSNMPDDLPEEAVAEREFMAAAGITANVSMPLMVGTQPVCVLILSYFGGPREWDSVMLSRLRLVGDVLANALARRGAAGALAESHRRYEMAVAAGSVGIWEWDEENKTFSVDSGCKALFAADLRDDCTEADAADYWIEHLEESGRQELCDAIDHLLKTAKPGFELVQQISRPNGSPRWMLCRGNIGPNANADDSCVLGTLTSITQEKKLEGEKLALAESLAYSNRISAVAELGSLVGKELRSPLSEILSETSQALDHLNSGDSSAVSTALSEIAYKGQRVLDLVQRFQPLTRNSPGDREPLAVDKLVASVLRLVKGDLIKNKTGITVQVDEKLPNVSGDATQLQQVILNIMCNAIHVMARHDSPERAIQLTIRTCTDNRIHVAIQDSGPGASDEILDQMFETFVTTKKEGLGTGLLVSRTIINAHGGELSARRNDGPGLTVEFWLPVAS